MTGYKAGKKNKTIRFLPNEYTSIDRFRHLWIFSPEPLSIRRVFLCSLKIKMSPLSCQWLALMLRIDRLTSEGKRNKH